MGVRGSKSVAVCGGGLFCGATQATQEAWSAPGEPCAVRLGTGRGGPRPSIDLPRRAVAPAAVGAAAVLASRTGRLVVGGVVREGVGLGGLGSFGVDVVVWRIQLLIGGGGLWW